jgi:chromosome partitioning protein
MVAGRIAGLIADARSARLGTLDAYAVLNAVDPQGRDNEDAAAALRALEGVEFLPVTIGRRKAFPNAFSAGLAVTEYAPRDPKAVSEMLSVVSATLRYCAGSMLPLAR